MKKKKCASAKCEINVSKGNPGRTGLLGMKGRKGEPVFSAVKGKMLLMTKYTSTNLIA